MSNIWPLKPANRWVFIAGFALISPADARRVAIIAAALVTPNGDFQPLKVAAAKAEQSSGGGGDVRAGGVCVRGGPDTILRKILEPAQHEKMRL